MSGLRTSSTRSLLAGVWLGFGSCATELVPAPQPAPVALLQPVPAVFAHGCVYIRARVGAAADQLLLLDTGATASAIDASRTDRVAAQSLGETEVLGTLGTERVPVGRVDAVEAGDVRVGPIDLTLSDLSGLLPVDGEPVAGILGADFLCDVSLRLDFDAKSVAIGRGRFDPTSEPGRRYAAIPFELDSGIPRFVGRIDGVETSLRLDTGASLFASDDVYVNVTETTWDRLRERDPTLAPDFQLQAAGIGGTTELPVARVGSLELGSVRIERPYVIVQPARGYFALPAAAGFFGNNLLEKHGVAVIDYPSRLLYVTGG